MASENPLTEKLENTQPSIKATGGVKSYIYIKLAGYKVGGIKSKHYKLLNLILCEF